MKCNFIIKQEQAGTWDPEIPASRLPNMHKMFERGAWGVERIESAQTGHCVLIFCSAWTKRLCQTRPEAGHLYNTTNKGT